MMEKSKELSALKVESYEERLTRQAEAGGGKSMLLLSNALMEGEHGVRKNQKEAIRWLEKAAETGHPLAMLLAAVEYRQATSVEQDLTKYRNWLLKAARTGYPPAMRELSVCYDKGLFGFEKNSLQAWSLMKKAAEADHPKAQQIFAHMHRDVKYKNPPDREGFFQWMERAAFNGDTDAIYNMSVIHFSGEEVLKDEVESLAWLYVAAQKQHKKSVVLLPAVEKKTPAELRYLAQLRSKEIATKMEETILTRKNKEQEEIDLQSIYKVLSTQDNNHENID